MAVPAARSPRIAIVIPAYNHEAYVAEAIASVLGQDWPDLELHVLDDGSTDGTAARLKRLGLEVTELRILRLPVNSGQSAALGLLRICQDQQRPPAAEGEFRIEVVARMQDAGGRERAALTAVAALDVDLGPQVVDAVLAAEGRHELHAPAGLLDIDRDRKARGFGLGRQRRPPMQDHTLGDDRIGLETALEQGRIAPAQGEVAPL